MDPHFKFQKLVFPEGILYKRGEGFGTARLGLIYEMNEACGDNKSLLVDPSGVEPLTSAVQKRRSTN